MTTTVLDPVEQVSELVLTDGQQSALDMFLSFLCNPEQHVFVVSGYSGCGKSTLVKELLRQLPKFLQTYQLLMPDGVDYMVQLTATTNQAAENFAQITGQEVKTIHSFLGLRVRTDWGTGKTFLSVGRNVEAKEMYLLFIDEASFIDSALLQHIFDLTKNCKIIFIGDPAQLIQHGTLTAPVFAAGFPEARLTEVMRQAKGNPIIDLSTKFRESVETGEFFSFKPDGKHIRHLSGPAFEQEVLDEFTRPDWKFRDSKVLAWTNKRVVAFNKAIRNHAKGDPELQVHDFAVCNSFVQRGKESIKTDALVQITNIREELYRFQDGYTIKGKWFTLDGRAEWFMPDSFEEKTKLIKLAKANDDTYVWVTAENEFIDLRAAYACTVNKSQGSTYGKVFLDLNDIGRCNATNQLFRMLYVGVSRAQHEVILTGDLV